MKYKYIVGLLIALGFSNAFAADETEEPIAHRDYQAMYEAFTCLSVKEINTALKMHPTFNHKNDIADIIRSSQTGLALRKAVIGLDAANLQAVVEKNPEFFKTSLGVSLVYGWTLNQFEEPVTPYYIGYYFSFDKLFQGLANKMTDSQVSTFLKSAFRLGLSAVEADRWAFYDHMLYLPYAIEQVRHVGAAGDSTLSIDDVIKISHRTKEEAKAEKTRMPGRAAHLMNETSFDTEENNLKDHEDATALVSLQQLIIQNPGSVFSCNPFLLETLLSLPADTDLGYRFLERTLVRHIDATRGVAKGVKSVPPSPHRLSAADLLGTMHGTSPTRKLVRRNSTTILAGNRDVALNGILSNITLEDVDLQIRLAAAEEALDVLKDVAFLNEDNFGSQMKDARTQFIQNLARYAKKVSTDFMKDNVVYSTVIAYGRHENLTAWYTMGTPQKRANITTVKTALIVWLTTHAETLKQQIDAATLSFSGVDSGLKSSGGRSLLHYLGSELDLSASELEGAA